MKDDLALVLYTSTKGHFGYKNSYQFTVNRLQEQIESFKWLYKLAHIKVSPDEKEIGEEMKKWLNNKGFRVILTEADWKHDDPTNSHAKEYYKDKYKTFSNEELNKRRYVLFCEDDWLVDFGKKGDLYLNKAIEFLDRDLNYLCVRVNNEIERDTSKATPVEEFIYKQNKDYTNFGPTLTFQPTIIRTAEWRLALRFINKNLTILNNVHCEILSGSMIKSFTDNETPFCFFNPKVINCEHIGEKEKLKKLNNE